MGEGMEKQLGLLKRAGIKVAYESLVLGCMAMGSVRTAFDLKTGNRPLSVPVPKVKKADKIEKVLFAARRYDNRYNNSTCLDYNYFFEPLCDVADVSFFDIGAYAKIGRKRANEQFLEAVEREEPDLVFSCLVGAELFPKTILHVSESTRAITCNWFADDHWRFDYFGRQYAPYFNFCVTVDEVSLDKYRRLGYENILMSQWGANSISYHRRTGVNQDMDVTFVGQNYSNRTHLINKLKKKGVDVQCFGGGWDNDWVPLEKMMDIYHRSKISLNFSGSVLGPTKQLKGRVFDIPACGGFLLTEHSPGLEKYYQIGKELEAFKDTDEAVEKILHYLDNEEERKEIAERGYQRTLKEHTYQHRLRNVFAEILAKANRA